MNMSFDCETYTILLLVGKLSQSEYGYIGGMETWRHRKGTAGAQGHRRGYKEGRGGVYENTR